MQIDLRIDAQGLLQRLDFVAGKRRDQLVAQALNGTAGTVRAAAAREISGALGGAIKTNQARKAVIIKPRATANSLLAVLKAVGRARLPLGEFPATQDATGVSVRIGRQRVRVPHAWLRTPRGWNRKAVRVRASSFKGQLYTQLDVRMKRVKHGGLDYPIAEVFAPGVPVLFADEKLRATMKRIAIERFAVLLRQQINRVLKGA